MSTIPPQDEPETENEEDNTNPSMHVDYRVFEVEVQGGDSEDLEDVNDIMDERLQTALQQIEALKRTDFNLDEEFDVDRSNSPGGMMTQ